MAVRNYDQEASDHPEHRYAYDFDYRMHGYAMRTFEDYFLDGNVLELGCFRGNFTKLLCARFKDVEVVDASQECIVAARELAAPGTVFHHATFEAFEPKRQYDNILLVHTLEHLDEPVDMLRRIGAWLTPKGRLFVSSPNARAASRQIAVNMGLIAHASAVTAAELAHGHRVTYAFDTLQHDVLKAGLRVVHKGGIFFKGLANFQLDAAFGAGIISDEYMEGCYQLGAQYPDLCSSIFIVCSRA